MTDGKTNRAPSLSVLKLRNSQEIGRNWKRLVGLLTFFWTGCGVIGVGVDGCGYVWVGYSNDDRHKKSGVK